MCKLRNPTLLSYCCLHLPERKPEVERLSIPHSPSLGTHDWAGTPTQQGTIPKLWPHPIGYAVWCLSVASLPPLFTTSQCGHPQRDIQNSSVSGDTDCCLITSIISIQILIREHLPRNIPERLPDSLLTLLLGVRWCLTKILSLFCFYYSTCKKEFPGTVPQCDDFSAFSIESNSEYSKYLPRTMRAGTVLSLKSLWNIRHSIGKLLRVDFPILLQWRFQGKEIHNLTL